MTAGAVLRAYVWAFVDELARAGVRHACVCPGSRSAPLAMVLAEHPGIRVWMHVDERSASYFGLGIARASREPVALLCTSGTAAANFMPAVIEARYARVPLVVLTADRPPELWEVGAPQTIDQIRLYGQHAKWFAQAMLPESSPEVLRYARTLAARVTATARSAPAGPVHVNFPFREPLIPAPDRDDGVARRDRAPYVAVAAGKLMPDPHVVECLRREIAGVERGLIMCGPQDEPRLAPAVAALAASLGWPILADPLSGLRVGPHDRNRVIDAYDALLRDDRFAGATEPDVVLRFGAMPTSKSVLLYLQRHVRCRLLVVDGGAGWSEPTALASDMIQADPVLLSQALTTEPGASASAWEKRWLEANRVARAAIATALAEIDEPFEGRVFAELAEMLPDGSTLYAGNSMPVRDLDTFFPAGARQVTFLSNRGANGIEGVVSSALGASAVSPGPTVLVIGDLSFYHDMNGLLAAKRHRLDATIVLLNNDGGGIFSFLPQAAHPEHFEMLFGTPHGLDFRPAVEMYGGRYARVTTWTDFRREVANALNRPGLKVIEVPTDRVRNVEQHRRIWPAVSAALAEPTMVAG